MSATYVTHMYECSVTALVTYWNTLAVCQSNMQHTNYVTHNYATLNYVYMQCDSTMGWLQLVGSLKLSVSFAEYRLFYRALLQKRPII